jgi:hypothetical protein
MDVHDILMDQAKWWQERAAYFKTQSGLEALHEFYYSRDQAAFLVNQILVYSEPEIVQAAITLVYMKLSN